MCPVFAVSRMQHISDLHSKFALRAHHVYKYGRQVDIHSMTAEIRRQGKEEEKKKPQDENIMSASATQGGYNKCVSRLARRKSHHMALCDATAPTSDCPLSPASKGYFNQVDR